MNPEPLFPVENTSPVLGINFPLKSGWYYRTVLTIILLVGSSFWFCLFIIIFYHYEVK
jgi:hypothetical protein